MTKFWIDAWGDYACFTRPDVGMSYEVPTATALEGMLKGIFWHPGVSWRIHEVHVLNPIRWLVMYNNGVGTIPDWTTPVVVEDDRQQLSCLCLRNVRYRICASMIAQDQAKAEVIFNRRLINGQQYFRPYFGRAAMTANLAEVDTANRPEPIAVTKDLGVMLHSLDYTDPGKPQPTWARLAMHNGVVNYDDAEVFT